MLDPNDGIYGNAYMASTSLQYQLLLSSVQPAPDCALADAASSAAAPKKYFMMLRRGPAGGAVVFWSKPGMRWALLWALLWC